MSDVISSGTLCEKVKSALPDIEWLATVCAIDTRFVAEASDAVEIGDGIECHQTEKLGTGPVFALTQSSVQKYDPSDVSRARIVSIDPITVCPQRRSGTLERQSRSLWKILESRKNILGIGHFEGGEAHHYIYYVNAKNLFHTADPTANSLPLGEVIANSIVEDLVSYGYDPNCTAIIHPPIGTSYGHIVARYVQELSGALHRWSLYADTFAGQRRFSTFAEHGIPIRGGTVVVIDDGANSGETLLALLHAAAIHRPSRILAYVVLTRMPRHKLEFFRSLGKLTGVSSRVEVKFRAALGIPVFSRRHCPICRLRRSLSELEQHCVLLKYYANDLSKRLAAVPARSTDTQPMGSFPWQAASTFQATRVREAVELTAFEDHSDGKMDKVLKLACSAPNAGADAVDALRDLAFVVCCEPDLLEAPIFAPYIHNLTKAVARTARICDESVSLALFGFGYHLLVQLVHGGSQAELPELAQALWEAILQRDSFTVKTLGELFCLALAEARREHGPEGFAQQRVCLELSVRFPQLDSAVQPQDQRLLPVFGRLYARGTLWNLQHSVDFHHEGYPDFDDQSLYFTAAQSAGKFYSHAAQHVKKHVAILTDAPSDGASAAISHAIYELAMAFDQLHELESRLCQLERTFRHQGGETPGVDYWGDTQLLSAMGVFGDQLARAAGSINDPHDVDFRALDKVAPHLEMAATDLIAILMPAFATIFPRVLNQLDSHWSRCEELAGLPSCALKEVKYNPKPPSGAQVFIPETLLSRFLTVAMENLGSAAFLEWTAQQKENEAATWIEIIGGSRESNPTITVRVVDNGRLHSTGAVQSGTHRGIDDVSKLASKFEAEVRGPVDHSAHTYLEMEMHYRRTGEVPDR